MIEAYYQPYPEYQATPVVIVGFSADGAFGSSPVAVYYCKDKPTETLRTCPVSHLRIKPVMKAEGQNDK